MKTHRKEEITPSKTNKNNRGNKCRPHLAEEGHGNDE
jgi:hypothetical protein